jgi:hypothetical protein
MTKLYRGDTTYIELEAFGYGTEVLPSYRGGFKYGKFKIQQTVEADSLSKNPPGPPSLLVAQRIEPGVLYWQPIPGTRNFIKYVTGAETTPYDPSKTVTAAAEKEDSSANKSGYPAARYFPYVAGTRIKYTSTVGDAGQDIYVATARYAKWSSVVGNSTRKNPYEDKSQVQLWVRLIGARSTLPSSEKTGIFYWYDPIIKFFYACPPGVLGFSGDAPNESAREAGIAASLEEGRIQALIAQGKTREQAEAIVRNSGSSGSGSSKKNSKDNGSQTSDRTAEFTKTVRIRGNFGFVGSDRELVSEPQMVQYYSISEGITQEPARFFFRPKPNQVNYQNLGSEWTEIDRAGRIPLIDWKNYRLMQISFQFLVLPDDTYRLGAFGNTADDGITLSIDEKLDTLRSMASRPFPVILYGFDDLLANSSPFTFSEGAGAQFAITDFTISSLIRTPNGSINRATCDVTMREVPIEYINLISMPKIPTVGEPLKSKIPGEPNFPKRTPLEEDLAGTQKNRK